MKKLLGTMLCCWMLLDAASIASGATSARLNTKVFPYRFDLDGQSALPHLFFFNTDHGNDTYLRPQVEKAAKAGVHLYSIPFWVHMKHPTDEPNFAYAEAQMQKFINVDPKAQFLVRLGLGPNRYWKDYHTKTEANKGEYFTYADGTSANWVSFSSKGMREPTSIQLRKIVRHFEAKYPARIIAYHVATELSENFDINYQQKGADYSEANTLAFRAYLKERYKEVSLLRNAWGDSTVDFSTAQVPQPAKGRWPMRLVTEKRIRALYKPVKQRAWIDYSLFYSKLIADNVIRWCRIVKEETQGNKMTAAFYGYLFTLPGSFNGHLNLSEVLKSEYVDILCSPMNYTDRAPGGPGTFMSPVDSVALHKKLWINEDDTRTHTYDMKILKRKPGFGACTTMDETLGVLDRNMANILNHSSGIWWMDLNAAGMYNAQEIWDLIKERQAVFTDSTVPAKATTATVQLIVDEKSQAYFSDDYGFHRSVMKHVQTALNRSSATVEAYLFSDYVNGKTPRADMVVFASTFRMSAAERTAVKARLARDKSHRVWCFLPGFIGEDGTYDINNVEALTGFAVYLEPGRVGSSGTTGLFKDLNWNHKHNNLDLEDRPVVSGQGGTVIGQYITDSLPSSAMKVKDGIYSFYLGSPGATAQLFRSIFRTASVHLWADQPALVNQSARALSVYTGKAGGLTLNLPTGVTLKTLSGDPVKATAGKVALIMDKTGIRWFEYSR